MSEGIAVHCKTSYEIRHVQLKAFGEMRWDLIACAGVYIGVDEQSWDSDISQYEGYHIMSAKEYLNNQKGGDSVDEEIKVGDKVLITGIQSGKDYSGQELVVAYINMEWSAYPLHVTLPSGMTWGYARENYEIINNQTNNIKGEDKMEISNNIFEVFDKEDMKKVQARFGTQYGNADRDLLALRHDKDSLLKIIKEEEAAAKKEAEKD